MKSNSTPLQACKKTCTKLAIVVLQLNLICVTARSEPDWVATGMQRQIWPTAGENFPKTRELEPDLYARRMQAAACQDFVKFTVARRDQAQGFNTDQLVVLKNGIIVYEFFDKDTGPNSPHSLWSASKTVTGTIIGAAIKKGLIFQSTHKPISIDTKIAEIFPLSSRLRLLKSRGDFEGNYENLKVENLLNMTAGFKWMEAYDSGVQNSTFMPMLYGSGHKNMGLFALLQPMDIWSVGEHFNYSGGNMAILMWLLRDLTGPGQAYDSSPKQLLFDKIGASDAFFEKDGSGYFVGSSYAYLKPYEMTRLGYLFLNGGVWNHEQLLPEDWMSKALQLNEGVKHTNSMSRKQKLEFENYLVDEGIYGNRTLWINKSVDADDFHIPVPYPNSPQDMVFAAGHYGQLIIVLPSQDMVIARTGHDQEYDSKIDPMVAKAIDCFAGDGKVRELKPNPHPPAEAPSGIIATAQRFAPYIPDLHYALRTTTIQRILAKEVCSCVYVAKNGGESQSIEARTQTCLRKSGLPLPPQILSYLVRTEASENQVSARSESLTDLITLFQGQNALATYLGEGQGCILNLKK